jgi:hypothetical protein
MKGGIPRQRYSTLQKALALHKFAAWDPIRKRSAPPVTPPEPMVGSTWYCAPFLPITIVFFPVSESNGAIPSHVQTLRTRSACMLPSPGIPDSMASTAVHRPEDPARAVMIWFLSAPTLLFCPPSLRVDLSYFPPYLTYGPISAPNQDSPTFPAL